MHDPKKIEEAVLALLGVYEFENGRTWTRIDFAMMQSLANQGLISEPKGKAESLRRMPETMARANALADRLFCA